MIGSIGVLVLLLRGLFEKLRALGWHPTEAVVVSVDRDSFLRGLWNRSNRLVTLEYTAETDHQVYQITVRDHLSFFKKWKIGDTMKLRVSPRDPEKIENTQLEKIAAVFAVLFVVFAVAVALE